MSPPTPRRCVARCARRPDVILLGEMRDQETIGTAMTAAEMAQLLFSTLHTTGASSTVDRIIDAFPANQQRQIRHAAVARAAGRGEPAARAPRWMAVSCRSSRS